MPNANAISLYSLEFRPLTIIRNSSFTSRRHGNWGNTEFEIQFQAKNPEILPSTQVYSVLVRGKQNHFFDWGQYMRTLVTGNGGENAFEDISEIEVIAHDSYGVIDSLTDEDRNKNLHPTANFQGYPKVEFV